MKRIFFILLSVFILLMSEGCSDTMLDTSDKIIAPQNNSIPLYGTWAIEKNQSANFSDAEKKLEKKWVGKTVEFDKSTAILEEYLWTDISYKIRRVDAEEYFLHKYKDSYKKLGIDSDEIKVITISSAEKFIYEIIMISESRALVNIENSFFHLRKISDSVDGKLDGSLEYKLGNEFKEAPNDNADGSSGLLLGIRTPLKTAAGDLTDNYQYRTLWIAVDEGKFHNVLEADDIFLPRKSGFWKVEVKRDSKKGSVEDEIFTYSLSEGNKGKPPSSTDGSDFWNGREGSLKRSILYIGNDYMSIECTGNGDYTDSMQTWKVNSLLTLPVDNLSNPNGINISDALRQDGALAMKNSLSEVLSKSEFRGINRVNAERQEGNFALYRKTGHWFIKGRFNFKQDNQLLSSDFNINLIPPSDMIAYDTLHLSWTAIKDRVPGAIDAFTSPNKDIALILTKNQIFVFTLRKGMLSDVSPRKIKLQSGDSIIMAEWARGDYVRKWESTFINNNKIRGVVTY